MPFLSLLSQIRPRFASIHHPNRYAQGSEHQLARPSAHHGHDAARLGGLRHLVDEDAMEVEALELHLERRALHRMYIIIYIPALIYTLYYIYTLFMLY